MAIITTPNQFKYTGKGPVDPKSLVKTYAELLSSSTWIEGSTSVAYNGMIVSVWLNKEDTTKNGVYYLFDPLCTSTLKKPDYTLEENWHRLDGAADVSEFIERIAALEARVEDLEDDDKLHTYGYRSAFPGEGEDGHMYVAVDEKKTYVWANNEFIAVGGQEYEEPNVIYGGSAQLKNN